MDSTGTARVEFVHLRMSSQTFALGCLKLFDEKPQNTVGWVFNELELEEEIGLNHALIRSHDLNPFDLEMVPDNFNTELQIHL